MPRLFEGEVIDILPPIIQSYLLKLEKSPLIRNAVEDVTVCMQNTISIPHTNVHLSEKSWEAAREVVLMALHGNEQFCQVKKQNVLV